MVSYALRALLCTGGKVKQLKQPKKDRPDLDDVRETLSDYVCVIILLKFLWPSLCASVH